MGQEQLGLFQDPDPASPSAVSTDPQACGALLGLACGHALTQKTSRRTLGEVLLVAAAVVEQPGDPLPGAASQLRRPGPAPDATDSSSLARTLPLALAYGDARTLLLHSARLSALTHWAPEPEVCCAVYGLWIRELLSGADRYAGWRAALRAGREYESGGALALDSPGPRPLPEQFWSRLEDVTDRTYTDLQPSGWAGYCLECLEAAAWCAIVAGDAEQAIADADDLGGASHVIAMLTGGAVGAHWGAGGLPSSWLAELPGRRRIESLARQLAAHRDLP